MSSSKHPVGILGCGAMGAGIAQVAATHGFTVLLLDMSEALVRNAIDGVGKRLDRLVSKELLTKKQRNEELADTLAFLFWQFGVQGFVP